MAKKFVQLVSIPDPFSSELTWGKEPPRFLVVYGKTKDLLPQCLVPSMGWSLQAQTDWLYMNRVVMVVMS